MKNNIRLLHNQFIKTPDLITRKIKINFFHSIYVVFLETLVSQDRINDYILKKAICFYRFNLNNIPGANIKKISSLDYEYYLYNGYTLIFNKKDIYAVETRADLTRGISTNETEPSMKGPKNALVENIQTNIGLIKRRVHSANIRTEMLSIGRISNTRVAVLYIDKISNIEKVGEILSILRCIDTDIINDGQDFLKYLNNNKIFPTILSTERPDRCSEALVNGKIVIVTDESPNALILPATLLDFINPFADKYNSGININFTKIIRILCFWLSVMVPAFYIAIINYNQEAIPTSLIINFASQRKGVPFPATVECMIMLIICEILRESDLRFPSKYGSAISILGALVLGDAAVSAGLVSPIMIIITAFTYISSLIFSDIEIANALRIFRFSLLLLSSFFGLYGLLVGTIFFIVFLCDIKSFGLPYLFPIAPYSKDYMRKIFLKNKENKL